MTTVLDIFERGYGMILIKKCSFHVHVLLKSLCSGHSRFFTEPQQLLFIHCVRNLRSFSCVNFRCHFVIKSSRFCDRTLDWTSREWLEAVVGCHDTIRIHRVIILIFRTLLQFSCRPVCVSLLWCLWYMYVHLGTYSAFIGVSSSNL